MSECAKCRAVHEGNRSTRVRIKDRTELGKPFSCNPFGRGGRLSGRVLIGSPVVERKNWTCERRVAGSGLGGNLANFEGEIGGDFWFLTASVAASDSSSSPEPCFGLGLAKEGVDCDFFSFPLTSSSAASSSSLMSGASGRGRAYGRGEGNEK
jgi:hypothetical protein